MKIAVDAMGGDYAPKVIIEGAVMAASELSIPIILVGDRKRVEVELLRYNTRELPISIKHASEVIGMEDPPSHAIRKKRDSSIRVAFDLVKSGEASAVVSAGNSGAAMAAGMFTLKNLKGVDRAAIAVTIPTMKGPACVLDVGSTVDCKPLNLVQFGVMGNVYAKYILKKDNPKIGLLSNGEEEGKGNELTRETHEMLKTSPLNYIGYVEGRDIFYGDVDVVVCDGFVGNVVLKLSEGLVETLAMLLKREIEDSFLARLGYLLGKSVVRNLKKRLDYSEYGGAPLLGINGICIISHGASSAKAIKNAIIRASEYSKTKVNIHLTEELERYGNIIGGVKRTSDNEAFD